MFTITTYNKQYHMCTCHLIVKLAHVSSLKHYKLLNINILRSTLSVWSQSVLHDVRDSFRLYR